MKNILFCTFAVLAFAFNAYAQPGGAIWVGSRSSNPTVNAVHTLIGNANSALATGDVEKFLGYSSNDVALTGPITNKTLLGKTAVREASANAAARPSGSAPQYRYEDVLVRVLPNDYALAIWNVVRTSDNARSQGSATIRKLNGQWQIELCVCDLAEY